LIISLLILFPGPLLLHFPNVPWRKLFFPSELPFVFLYGVARSGLFFCFFCSPGPFFSRNGLSVERFSQRGFSVFFPYPRSASSHPLSEQDRFCTASAVCWTCVFRSLFRAGYFFFPVPVRLCDFSIGIRPLTVFFSDPVFPPPPPGFFFFVGSTGTGTRLLNYPFLPSEVFFMRLNPPQNTVKRNPFAFCFFAEGASPPHPPFLPTRVSLPPHPCDGPPLRAFAFVA